MRRNKTQLAAHLRLTRYHEAAHAVIHHHFGKPIIAIRVDPVKEVANVEATHWFTLQDEDIPTEPIPYIMGLLAGSIAGYLQKNQQWSWRKMLHEEILNGKESDSYKVCYIAEKGLGLRQYDQTMRQFGERTAQLLKEHWRLVELIAAALEHQTTLTALEFYALVKEQR